MNPNQIVQMIRSGQNPQQIMLQFLQQRMGGTPVGDNLIRLAQQGNGAEIERIIRNIYAQRGIDFDTEFSKFRNSIGLQ